MAPSHPRQRRRIEVDVLFAPVPQALVLDTKVSAQACRLWSVLYVFRWNDTPPDFDKLAAALGTTERSVYRWLQELEACGWIGWDRNASLADRFTLRMTCEPPENDTGVKSDPEELILRSNKLIPGSKRLTQVSEELTQVSISALLDGAPMPQNDRLSSDQNHENHENVGVVGASSENLFELLRRRGVGRAKAAALCATGADPATLLASIDNLYDPSNPKTMGGVIERLLDAPPPKGKPYERLRSSVADGSDPGRNRAGPKGRGADRASAARAPRPGDPAYLAARASARPDGTPDPE